MNARLVLALALATLLPLAGCPDATGVPIGDGGAGSCVSIAAVRGMSGDVSVSLCDVTVTYVHPEGFFVQAAQVGPAVHVPEAAAPTVAVGDVITLPVRRVGSLAGNVQVEAHGAIEVSSHGADVSLLRQDLSAGTPPGEELESEIVRVANAFHDGFDGPFANFNMAYGSAPDVPFCRGAYENLCSEGGSVDLCMTSTFTVDAVVMQFEEEDGTPGYRIHSLNDSDFLEVRCLETCWNDLDDDGDGLVDCNDPDCVGASECPCTPASGVDPLELNDCIADYGGCGCEPGCVDGFWSVVWYPESAGTFPPDMSPPAELLDVAVGRYDCSICTCDEGWSLRSGDSWTEATACGLCNTVLATGGLARWEGGCC